MARIIVNQRHRAFAVVRAAVVIVDRFGEPCDTWPTLRGKQARHAGLQILVWGGNITSLLTYAPDGQLKSVAMSNIAIEIWPIDPAPRWTPPDGNIAILAKVANLHPVGDAIECLSFKPGPWVDQLIAAAQRSESPAFPATVH